MINLRHLTLARGPRVLASDVDLTLHGAERIGVVGANGCGKSTLLDVLAGVLQPEAGDLDLPPGLRIARVLQETPGVEQPALDYVLDGDAELRRIQADIAAAESGHRADALAELHERLEQIDGYRASSRAAALLHGLGFAAPSQRQSVASFSGGWRMRLNLARALVARSDLLLLDEPTNHLDLDAVLWLERWLATYRGTLLLVSHDRDFLDGVVQRVLHFDGRTIVSYAGTYSDFEHARAQALANQQALHAKQQRDIAHLQSFVDRFRAKATKAKQAQSRLKALARMTLIAPAHVDSAFTFRFASPLDSPSPLLVLDQAGLGYDPANPVLRRVTLSLLPGTRIGLLGRNGAGKSTLVKTLAGELAPAEGERLEGRGLAIGYFAQHQLEQLRANETPLDHVRRLLPQAREQDQRDFLGRFGFGEQALAPVGPFSGGERARLALALVVARRPNLLLLDEPTNHLDIEMRHALTIALQEYEGAVVIVSHDRHLLRTTADDFWLVAGGEVRPFDGDLEDYRAWLASSVDVGAIDAVQDERLSRRDERRERARRQDAVAARRRPLERECLGLESELGRLGAERDAIDQSLIRGGAAGGTIADLHKRRAAVEAAIEAAEARWYELQEAIGALEAG